MRRVGAGRHQHQPGAGLDLGTDMLGEFGVVADRDADAAPWRVEDAGRGAAADAPLFGFEARHVPLVLEGQAAVGADQRRAVHDAAAIRHRQGAGLQPQPVADGGVAHYAQHGGGAADHIGQLGPRAAAQGQLHAGIFGQQQQVGAGRRCDPGVQPGSEIRQRCRLADRPAHHGQLHRARVQKAREWGVARPPSTGSGQCMIAEMPGCGV